MKELVKKLAKELIVNTVVAFVASIGTLMAIGLVGEMIEKRKENSYGINK